MVSADEDINIATGGGYYENFSNIANTQYLNDGYDREDPKSKTIFTHDPPKQDSNPGPYTRGHGNIPIPNIGYEREDPRSKNTPTQNKPTQSGTVSENVSNTRESENKPNTSNNKPNKHPALTFITKATLSASAVVPILWMTKNSTV